MWILGLKGLKVFTVFYFVLPYGEKKSFTRFSEKQLTDILHLKLFSRQNLFFKTSASDLYSLNIFKISQISAWIDFKNALQRRLMHVEEKPLSKSQTRKILKPWNRRSHGSS